MKKKTGKAIGLLLALLMVASLLPAAALAAEDDPIAPATGEAAAPVDIFVTISDKGVVVVPMGKVTVADLDANGTIDVNEALYAAHETYYYPGGAAAGYATAETEWGLSVAKLWGDGSGSFGYYNNNAMCWGLGDPVAEGDHLYAFVYADQTAWSDPYAYLDKNDYTAKAGEELSVTLTAQNGFDENWNPVFAPCDGAVIRVLKADTLEWLPIEKWSFTGGENGTYGVTINEAGDYMIVADKPEVYLVPAVAAVKVAPAGDPAKPIEVYVTISDKGVVTVPMKLVTVEDLDASGAFDVNEVLYAAHEAFYTGGAAAGYATASSDWGLSISKLWGVETASVGYYNNNAMCWGLTDPVVSFDHISAFVYADQTAWSDAYAYFDRYEYTPVTGISFDVKLMAASGFDENWSPVFAPCSGAVITAYYADTFEKVPADKWFAFGDDEGVYQITFKETGKYVIVGDKPEDFLVPAVAAVETFEHDCPCAKFTDFEPEAWYHEAVDYVVGHGIMKGTSATKFEPAAPTTRGMIATILYRLEGEPVIRSGMPFDDVKESDWYGAAVSWAESNGIVTGYGNGKFGPNDYITREQLATMFWRYAKYKGYDVSVGESTNILSYDDASDVSSWAMQAMQWAVGAGIVNGRTVSMLVPGEGANRAEAAAMILRFINNVVYQ
ncbi:MAG: S-layer homology domain-containing protein [Oscillospiraceae bacterium]|nr:S-layer homology domain-containing protein [Oscillospiraceae bacterium]